MLKRVFQFLCSLVFIMGVCVIVSQNTNVKLEYLIAVVGMLLVLWVFLRYSKKQRVLRSSLRKIDQMTGVEFEDYLMYQFRKKGYRVKTTPVSGDFGADLLIKKGRVECIVQAKRYSGSVGIQAIQEVLGAKEYYGIEQGMVITNSYFTKAAKELAEKCEIELWERKDITEEFSIKK